MLLHDLNVRCELKQRHREHKLRMSIPRSARNGENIWHISIISGLVRHKHKKCSILHHYSYILGIVLGRLFHAHTIHADHIQYLWLFLHAPITSPVSITTWTASKNGLAWSMSNLMKLDESVVLKLIRQGYILTNLINMSVKLFSTVSIVFFPVDFKSARYHSIFCIFN